MQHFRAEWQKSTFMTLHELEQADEALLRYVPEHEVLFLQYYKIDSS